MLSSVAIIDAVATSLADIDCPIVLDPVMVAKSGDALLAESAVSALRSKLLPRATLLTPNLPEATTLLDLPAQQQATSTDAMIQQGRALQALGPTAVLKNTHGTGCTLSSSIAAHLALGHPLESAVELSHAYLHEAIKAADGLKIGSGHGPVHHFHRQWPA